VFTDPGMYQGYTFTQYVFIAPVTEKLLSAKIGEGKGIILLKLSEVIAGNGFPSGSTDFLKNFEKKLKG
jgi:hypothetical protein